MVHRISQMEFRGEMELAAEQGDANALARLAFMCSIGDGGPVDLTEARRLYGIAAKQGSVDAQTTLAFMCSIGEGGPVDSTEARRLLDLAARQGHATAQTNLAVMYLQGHGGPVDLTEARRLLTLAADQGNAGAQINLALMYYRYARECGPQDLKEAVRLCDLAARQQGGTTNQNCRPFKLLSDLRRKLEAKLEEKANDNAEALIAQEECEKAAKTSKVKASKSMKKKARLASINEANASSSHPQEQGSRMAAVETHAAVEVGTLAEEVAVLTLANVDKLTDRDTDVPESTIGGTTTCIVCFTDPKSHLAAPCGHQCVCGPCSAKIDRCPICRQPVSMWIQVRVA